MGTRVLIVKLAALGDAIMASTLVPAIKARYADVEITWVTGNSIAPIIRSIEDVDRVIAVNDTALLAGNKVQAALAMLGAWRAIGRSYDVAYIAHTDSRYGLLSRASGATSTQRFSDRLAPRRGHWHGAEYVRLIDLAEYVPWNESVEDVFNAPRFPPLRAGALPAAPTIPGAGPLVVIAPGGARNVLRDDALRRWPIESWTAVVRALVQSGCRVVCVGSAADAVEGAACEAAGATDLTGGTGLLELAALVQSGDVVVTHDSGILHLAQILNRPTVALFGPTVPVERIAPFATVSVLTRAEGLPCAPCYDGFRYADCALNICLNRVPVAEVVAAVWQYLGA